MKFKCKNGHENQWCNQPTIKKAAVLDLLLVSTCYLTAIGCSVLLRFLNTLNIADMGMDPDLFVTKFIAYCFMLKNKFSFKSLTILPQHEGTRGDIWECNKKAHACNQGWFFLPTKYFSLSWHR